ncbi:MAG: peptide chain release factor N(5)-glutamine methyltransferase [Gemmatimonadota bacterium]|nr:MAG: peptide chain release factor N(5)-glutamine methyltransferase [Gemmatimonadota bacterium]
MPKVGEELRAAAHRLAQAGCHAPRREAAGLWARLSGGTVGEVWLEQDREAPEGRRTRYWDAVERRARGEPAAYAAGRAGFRWLELTIDPRVLIPRPETEGLVERVLGHGGSGSALDVGTGSGCIALSLATEGGFSRVVATDASNAALDVARANAARLAPRVAVEFRHGDLLEPVSGETFDAIVSNPPYVAAEEFEALDDGVRLYEPREALVSPEGGLQHSRRLLEGAAPLLAPGGLLALEVDSTRAEATLRLAREAGWRGARLESDLFGRLRYLLATKE